MIELRWLEVDDSYGHPSAIRVPSLTRPTYRVLQIRKRRELPPKPMKGPNAIEGVHTVGFVWSDWTDIPIETE